MKMYHLSNCDNISLFRPLTHFGTRSAALARRNTAWPNSDDWYLYECEVPIPENCLKVEDWHSPKPLAVFLAVCRAQHAGLDRRQYLALTSHLRQDSINDEDVLNGVLKLLDERDVSCLKYVNDHEDATSESLSYCLVDPVNVKIIKVTKQT